MPDSGGGPIKYVAVHPCPPESSSPLILSVPATVLELATDEQRARIAKIQVDFAQRVSRALQRSYGEIAAVLSGEVRSPRKKANLEE